MEHSNFDRLLEKYVKGELTPEENEKIELWLQVRKTKNEVNVDLTADEEEALFQKISSNTTTKEEIISFRPAKANRFNTSTLTLRIAAAIAVVGISSVLLWYVGFYTKYEHQLTATKIEKVILEDGTIAWLSAGSSLSYYESTEGKQRHAVLDGEGLFEVAKDPGKPFILQCGNYTIKVLGTSFSLNSYADTLRLKVLTGKVNVSTNTDPSGVMVMPNEAVIYTNAGMLSNSKLTTEQRNELVDGSEYLMTFNDIPLEQVIERVGTKFNVKFQFRVDRLGKCRVTGDFTDHSLALTMEMLSEALAVSFVRNDNYILIEGSGCD